MKKNQKKNLAGITYITINYSTENSSLKVESYPFDRYNDVKEITKSPENLARSTAFCIENAMIDSVLKNKKRKFLL